MQRLELEQAFFDTQNQDKIKLKRLELRKKELQSKIYKLEHPRDGLTELGRKMLSTPEKEADIRDRIEQLNQLIESVDVDIEQTQRSLAQKSLLFSGWVRVRIKS